MDVRKTTKTLSCTSTDLPWPQPLAAVAAGVLSHRAGVCYCPTTGSDSPLSSSTRRAPSPSRCSPENQSINISLINQSVNQSINQYLTHESINTPPINQSINQYQNIQSINRLNSSENIIIPFFRTSETPEHSPHHFSPIGRAPFHSSVKTSTWCLHVVGTAVQAVVGSIVWAFRRLRGQGDRR